MRKHGIHFLYQRNISKFVFAETKACAIIEYCNVKDAKNAFHNLSYAKFKHLPLFLEWAKKYNEKKMKNKLKEEME